MGMKKKLAANILAAAVALLLVAAGVLTVGWMQGWFDKKESGAAILTEIRSVVRMERGGVAYPVEEDTVLRAGDKIDCISGASAVVRAGGSTLTLGENAAATITEPLAEGFEVQAVSGEIFVDTTDTAALGLCGEVLAASDAVAWVRAESGAESIAVFAGQVGEAEAGQILSWQDGKQTIGAISSDALSDFAIVQLSRVDSARKLCFTAEELEQLQRDQQPAVQENADTESETAASIAENPAESSVTAAASESSENDAASEKPEGTESSSAVSTAKPTAIPKPTATPEPVSLSCTVSIRCDTILNNWDKLDSAKAGYVPATAGSSIPRCPLRRARPFLTSCSGPTPITAFRSNTVGLRCAAITTLKASTISMNLIVEASPAGCIRSTAGFRITVAPAMCCRTGTASSGAIPAAVARI